MFFFGGSGNLNPPNIKAGFFKKDFFSAENYLIEDSFKSDFTCSEVPGKGPWAV